MFQVHVTIDPEFTAAVRGLADAIAGRNVAAPAPAAAGKRGRAAAAQASAPAESASAPAETASALAETASAPVESASAPVETAPASAPAPAPAPAGEVTRDQVKAAALAYAEKHGRPAALAVLQEFGASSVPSLDAKHFAAALAKFQG